ncbi:hypothetical protein GOP47_0005570 [Adiantum capillus-veneris]|uniref:Uncharacterized protein n=1 Tax=Adiantum capillus-veneris TaxID=13818 RepID=A0A9D4V6A2_ADICA|nr:hypothetical protein GOP47_0005570 [Adiantum capillus-veneris]
MTIPSSLTGLPSNAFCLALEGQELMLLTVEFGLDWAKHAHPLDWETKHYRGEIVAYNTCKNLFKCMFDGDSTLYTLLWDSIQSYIIREEHMPIDADTAIAFDDGDDISLAEFLASKKREYGCSNVCPSVDPCIVNDVVATACDEDHMMQVMDAMDDALTMHAMSTHVEPMRGRPPNHKVFGRGRPKARHIEVDFDCHDTSEDVELHVTTRKAGTSHARGKGYKLGKKWGKVQKPLVEKGCQLDLQEEDDFGDEHASIGEEEECEDELLEAEGPVLHESDDETDFSIVCIPKWKSGDNLRVKPDGTFKKLPSFVDIAGPATWDSFQESSLKFSSS